MDDKQRFDRNLVALSARHPHLARRLAESEQETSLRVEEARSGHPVPVLLRNDRPFFLHSRFNPVAEGERTANAASGEFLVAFGLGGGYHLTPLLSSTRVTGLLIVETNLKLVSALFHKIDYSALLSDSRVILLVDPDPQEFRHILLERYLPILYGDLGTISLRSRVDVDALWFSQIMDQLKELFETLGRDLTVQAKFGRRWFIHTLANLPLSEQAHAVLPPSRQMMITAAGPSLHTQLPQIRKLKEHGVKLIATDTSLAFLSASGLVPDIVLSIDCQAVSYHHFLKGLPPSTVLVLDLASPPVIARRTENVLFVSSGHPFSLYINRFYRPFPLLDLSGGNVTHAALSLARNSGAQEIHLFGADYSYPMGQPYARGTYLYSLFHSQGNRIHSNEHAFWNFVHGSHPWREKTKKGWRLRTPAMDHYRSMLEESLPFQEVSLNNDPRHGSVLHLPSSKEPSFMVAAGSASSSWNTFLTDYAHQLSALPKLSGPPRDYLECLNPEDRQAWATLLPAAATFHRQGHAGPEAVEESRQWSIQRLQARHKHSLSLST
ncbi:MAG: DUF115 domain-containing protein [Spirochaetales bacterium]|nr:DUF115 domain-containing protein [Spirochaetales bacterium]